jgi:ATPase subunit of ABC transporter with duplicated ATPase domains
VLAVHDLSVEIGGRLVVQEATFTVMPKDKVGLVGRNGAGKTTLFKVLGGEAEPIAGKIMRKGGFGYLPQDPRIAGIYDGRTAISHILSGRNIDDDLMRLEKLRITMEEDSSERNAVSYTHLTLPTID